MLRRSLSYAKIVQGQACKQKKCTSCTQIMFPVLSNQQATLRRSPYVLEATWTSVRGLLPRSGLMSLCPFVLMFTALAAAKPRYGVSSVCISVYLRASLALAANAGNIRTKEHKGWRLSALAANAVNIRTKGHKYIRPLRGFRPRTNVRVASRT